MSDACPLCAGAGGTPVWQGDGWRAIRVDDADFPAFYRLIAQAHVAELTDLVPAAQLKKPKGAKEEAMRALALAVKELLHGAAAYEQRFDAFLAAFVPVYGEAARWELATAVIAVYSPNEHVCVQPAAFKQQVKVMGGRGSAPARATSAAYTRFLSVARLVSNKLREQNQEPRDLLDVCDFIRLTSGPAKPARLPAKPVRSKPSVAPAASDEADDDGDDE